MLITLAEQYVLWLSCLVIPPVLITCASSLIYNKLLNFNHGSVVRWIMLASSFVFIPAHEICHVLACLIFRYQITSVRLLERQNAMYTGHVLFKFQRNSAFHLIGLAVVGLAPAIVLVVLLHGIGLHLSISASQDYSWLSWIQDLTDLTEQWWDWSTISTSHFIGSVLLLLFAMHAIPSVQDLKMFIVGAIGVVTLFFAFQFIPFIQYGFIPFIVTQVAFYLVIVLAAFVVLSLLLILSIAINKLTSLFPRGPHSKDDYL